MISPVQHQSGCALALPTLALAGCDQRHATARDAQYAARRRRAGVSTDVSAAAQAPTMQNGTEAIRPGIAIGLRGYPCSGVSRL